MSHGTCPAGGKWYECTTGSNFFGCCTSDPCNAKGCPAADLKPAGLGTAPGPASETTKNPNGSWYQYEQCSAGQWYTCADLSPSFQGCCDINPCANKGCPSNNLHAATFKSIPPELKSSTSSTTPSTTIKTTTSNTSTSNTSTPTSTTATTTSATNSPTSTPVPAESKSSNTAIIAGAAAAGVALIGIIIVAFFLYRKRRRNQRANRNSVNPSDLVKPTPFTPKPYDADKLTTAFPAPTTGKKQGESLEMKKPTLPNVEVNPYKPIHHAEHAAPLFSPPLRQQHSPTPSMSKTTNLHSPSPYTDQTPPSSAGLGLPAYAQSNPNNLGVGVIAGGGRRIGSGGYEEIPQLDSTEIHSVPGSRAPSRSNSPGPVEMPDTSVSGNNTPRLGGAHSSMVSAESPVFGRGGLGPNGGRGVSTVSGVSELSSQNSASGTNLREGYTSWQSLQPPR